MGKLVMPKNSAVEEEIIAVLKIYYEEGDWLDNNIYKERLKAIIGADQYESSYTKKSQITSYFNFTTWEDFSNNRSRRKITESGKRFYLAWKKNDDSKMMEEIMYSLEKTTFGRDNCGCTESKSDIEAPALFIRAVLDVGYLTYKEFAFLLWKLEDCGVNYTDSIQELILGRENGNISFNDVPAAYTDAKPITMLIRWGFLAEDGKIGQSTKIMIAPNIIDRYKSRLLNLKIYNVDKNIENNISYDPIKFKTGLVSNFEHNRIVFGAPGTGKSYMLKKDCEKLMDGTTGTYERVTFYPDYVYSHFIGAYKPVTDDNGLEIKYDFVPGPFMRVYVDALKSGRTDNPQPHLLLIEELNRAKVATVFGDIFQLLDRDETGMSEYEIQTSEDVRRYLTRELGGEPEAYKKLKIPDNMFIWATMNSADQGVFPMDTAFKRRWNFEYLGINENNEEIKGKVILGKESYEIEVEWNKLRKAINEKLSEDFKVNEDKLIGPYFLSKNIIETISDTDDTIANSDKFINAFKNKVIMYLYEDAAKQSKHKLFEGCKVYNYSTSKYSSICQAFDDIGIYIFGDGFKELYENQEV